MQSLMENLAADNPKLKMIIDYMEQQNQQKENNANDLARQRKILIALKKEKMKNNQLLKQANELLGLNEELGEFVDDIASALGACPSCWGEVQGCEICHGKGKTGYFKINKALFMEMIFPAIEKATWIKPLIANQN